MEAFLAALIGGAIYRARGNGLWHLPRPIWQVAFALAYGVAAWNQSWMVTLSIPYIGSVTLTYAFIVLVSTTGAVLTGHASLIDLGSATKLPADGQSDEWYSGWIPWPGTYAHDFIGLIVSGLLITAPCGVALIAGGHYRQGGLVLVSGALKAPAYAIGRFAPVADKLKVSEPLVGIFLWGSLALIVIR